MKTYKLIQLACMVVLMGAATGCADDVLVEGNGNQNPGASKGQPVTIQASVAGGSSRVDFGNEVDNKISLTWQEDDVLKVFNPASEAKLTEFALTDGEGTASGVFEGTPAVPFNDNDKLYAFYNNGMATADITTEGNVVLTLKNQDGQLKNDNYLLMYGETSYQNGNVQEVSLSPLFSILKVNIPTDKTLKEVTLMNGEFRNKATLILNSESEVVQNFGGINVGDLVYNYQDDETENNSDITVTGTFEPVDGNVTVYFYVFPSKRYSDTDVHFPNVSPKFKAVDMDGVEYVSTKSFEPKDLGKGKMYRVNSGIFHIVDFENEGTAKGTPDDPFEIANVDQLYSLFLKVHRGYTNNGQSYEDCHYKLTNDIEMDDRVLWGGINLYGSFDGDGHTISGPTNSSFISELFGGTIKNLVLDLDIQGNVHASLLMRSYGGTIINCVNKSTFSTNKDLVGGLVADMITDSKMIACANLGNITVNAENVQSVGGLVGNLSSGSTIEGCYSTSTVTVSAANGYVGTLVGKIEGSGDTGNSLMTACWSRVKGSLVGFGEEDTDYVTCYGELKIEDYSETSIKTYAQWLNEALKKIGSDCRFNVYLIPSICAETGNVGGSNFGDGGEF